MTDYNGAYQTYADATSPTKVFFKNTERLTKTLTILSGQVLKARSFVQTDADGKGIAFQGVTEKALVTFADITVGQTLILGGLTFTAGAGGTVKASLVTAWSNLTDGMTAAQANAANPVADGSFTAGTLTGWNTDNSNVADSVEFISTNPYTNVTDLADTGTATDPAIVTTTVPLPNPPRIAGVTVFDVDASGGDVETTVWTEASFWADALVWKVNVGVDTITLYDGTTVNCTPYNTGCDGTTAAAILLQKKFVEGSEFDQLGYLKAGEQY